MMVPLYWKHLLVRTPLEGLAKAVQHKVAGLKVLRHPGLKEVYLEDGRIDRALKLLVRPDSNCVDVGAHLGSTLSPFLKLAPKGKHWAFEPLPQKAEWLRKKFPDVEVRELALSETAGRATFTENLTRSGFSGLVATIGAKDRVREVSVEVDRLDDVIPAGERVDFLKIDVEGAEPMVLRGANRLLKQYAPPVLFESGPGGSEKFGMTRRDLFLILTAEHGYSVFLVKSFLESGPPLDFEGFDRAHTYPFLAFNYLAVKR
jgi:FkbM family methyltransferase